MTTIPDFPTLYNNKNKKVYEWSIKIEYAENDSYNITVTHGEKEGKKIKHVKTISEGKASRSALEQAILESSRKWINKKDKELYVENISGKKSLTDSKAGSSNIIVRPMLANKFSFDLYKPSSKSRAFKIAPPLYCQRKYDGIRCISYLKDGKLILESRKGVAFENFDNLKTELLKLFKKLPQNFYFDGELFTDQIDFEVISGLIRLSEKKCTAEDRALINTIEYHVYDFVDLDQLALTYSERLAFLRSSLKSSKLIICVETFFLENIQDVKVYHDKFIQEGFEGIMIRDPNGPYEVQKRSKYLQKYKEFMEEEFKIVGFHEGDGDEKGAIVWDCITSNGSPFAVRPKGTFETRKKLFSEGTSYIGKDLTVIFQEYTSDGIPRFPVGKSIRDIY